MPNPDTITVDSERKYFFRFSKTSVFNRCLFPSQSKLQLYSHYNTFYFKMRLYFSLLLHLTIETLLLINATLFLPNCDFLSHSFDCLVIATLFFKM